MRCPKCGAFMDEGRDVCFMCGTNVKSYTPGMQGMNNNANYYNQNTNMQGGFQGNNQAGAFPGLNDYDNIYNNVKNNDKDVFDFFSDHKELIKFLTFLFIVAVVGITGLIYYKVKTKTVAEVPVLNQLYYEISDEFKLTKDGEYSLSGETGSSCNITVGSEGNSASDYVDALFENIKHALEPNRDPYKLTILNKLDIYTTQTGTIELGPENNKTKWFYMNVFYPKTVGGDPILLKRRYLTTVYKGYSYSIELRNNDNDPKCSGGLDNFVNSLKFLDVEIKEK
jgi:hypothetical protein